MSRVQRYTNEQLLESLRVMAKKLGRIPRQVDLYRCSPSYKDVWKRFGSLGAATRAAGLSIQYHRPHKLTPAQRKEIGRRHRPGNRSSSTGNTADLATEYGVTMARISQIGREARNQ